DAQAAYKKAKAHADEYQEKLSRVDEEVASLLGGAKREGESERDQIIADAESYSGRLVRDADRIAEQESMYARDRLRESVVEDVLEQSQAILETKLTPEDQERLLEQAIADLEDGRAE